MGWRVGKLADSEPTWLEKERKRLHLAAWRRGIREMDLILGRYFDEHNRLWNKDELNRFAELLARSDRELYDIIAGFQTLADDDSDYPLLSKIRQFARAGRASYNPAGDSTAGKDG